MKLTKEDFLGDFMIAVEHLTNYKPKSQLLASGSIKRTFSWFPIVGLLLGSAVTLICATLYTIFATSLSIAFTCGVLYVALSYYLEVDKGINALLKLTAAYAQKKHKSEFKTIVSENLQLITISAVLSCKVIMSTILLYHHHAIWLILPFILTRSTVGAFAASIKKDELQLSDLQVNSTWIIAIILSTLLTKIYGFAVAGSTIFIVKQLFTKLFKQDESIQYLLLTAGNEILFCIILLSATIILV
jgi:hypothetical protein